MMILLDIQEDMLCEELQLHKGEISYITTADGKMYAFELRQNDDNQLD